MSNKGIRVVTDDVECFKILTDTNNTDLKPKPPFNQVHTVFRYNNHYCLAMYDATPGDSGYTIIMIDMDHMSSEEAAEFFMNFTMEVSHGTIVVEEFYKVKPQNN